MASIHRSALLPYSAGKVYDLVNDVGAYPQFMDGCVAARVLEESGEHMVARLDLSRAGISQSFTTRNILAPKTRIHLTLEEGPFENFSGCWCFEALREDACKVTLDLDFRLRRGLLGAAAARLLDSVTNNLVDAVVRRARQTCIG